MINESVDIVISLYDQKFKIGTINRYTPDYACIIEDELDIKLSNQFMIDTNSVLIDDEKPEEEKALWVKVTGISNIDYRNYIVMIEALIEGDGEPYIYIFELMDIKEDTVLRPLQGFKANPTQYFVDYTQIRIDDMYEAGEI